MQKRNDIYNKESVQLPRRRGGGASQSGGGSAKSGRPAHSLYGERERHATLAEDLRPRGSARSASASRRNRRQRQGMSVTNKIVLILLFALLFGYVAILAASLYRTHQSRQAQHTAAPALAEVAAEHAVESVEPDTATTAEVNDVALRAERDTEQTGTHIVNWKTALAGLERAQESFDRGEAQAATERLERAIALAPHIVDLKLLLADMYMEEKRFEEARDLYVRILETDPLKQGVRLKWANALLALRHYDAALLVSRWLLEDDQFLEEPNQIAAISYLATDRTAEAVPHLRRQVSINRDNIVAQNNLAVAYSRLGDYPRAVAMFREVLEADPGNAITYYNLAVSHAQQGDAQQAVDTLNRAMERFGMPFVSAWFKSKDFDPIRSSPAFRALETLWETSDDAV